MKKIIEYTTIWINGDDEGMGPKVNRSIKEGWQPFGGISHLWDEEDQTYSYCQALVKYEN